MQNYKENLRFHQHFAVFCFFCINFADQMRKVIYNKFDKTLIPTLPRITFNGRVVVVLNEKEATLPVKTDQYPYYKWEDVRAYYLKKLDDFDLVILMITDVLQEGSHLLYVGSDDIIQQAFGIAPKNSHVFLPKVMSRKKQIIPMLTALWG